jgi:hypothetical protein
MRNTIPPRQYSEQGAQLIFPKDAFAGGTWIGASGRKRFVCLLNGGFTAHERKDQYRMSRGIIVTDLLTATDAVAAIQAYDFKGVEPFTLVMVDWQMGWKLFQLVWDEQNAHFEEKPLRPYIWSSSLLYSETIRKKREHWFAEFLNRYPSPSEGDLLTFHKTAGEGNAQNDVVMDRGFVKTKSITQVVAQDSFHMRYEDLQQHTVSETSLIY